MGISRSGFLAIGLLLQFLDASVLVSAQGEGENVGGICSLDLNSFLPPPYGNLSQMNCQPIWNTFVLRYSQSTDNVVTFVLSALYTSGWVGIGFSKNGKMGGASSMVGWISRTGHARIKQYYAEGYTSAEVKPGRGNLNFTTIPPAVVLNGANIYLAFQLKFSAPLGREPTLLAFSSRYPSLNTHQLHQHDDKTSILIDYSAGIQDSGIKAPAEPKNYEKMKRSHGVLGLVGWGLILPVGTMVARFLRHKEPLWFYLHTIIQFAGFFTILAGVVVGQALYNDMNANVAAHRGIGYFALTLTILQVLAFFIRPERDSKIRGMWNIYHKFFGVIALFFGALNIVYGIQVGGAGSQWKIGYGFLLGLVLVTSLVLQLLSMLRSKPEKTAQPPAYQMN